jgi:beta-galactosidase
MRLGVCWYPEQDPRSTWAADVRLMRDLGLDVVRIGEFAWSAYEPGRDDFHWEWLDEAVALAHDAGLHVVLGTPTATPPRWLTSELPDILSVADDGSRRNTGGRRHVCLTSHAYRAESRRITLELARRYGDHPAIIGWQLDNEMGNHDSALCWCSQCQHAFSRWLARRFDDDIAALNDAWGTIFWSGTYNSFDDVEFARPVLAAPSPHLVLAHRRFASHQARTFLDEQAEILRTLSPGRDLITNHYLGDEFIDLHLVAGVGTVASHDNYPHGAIDHHEVGFRHDLTRGMLEGRPGWVMEQQPGQINWTAHNPATTEADVLRWLWQAHHHGIDTLLIFRWRAARHGQEQYHAGLLDQAGRRTVGWRAVERYSRDRSELPDEQRIVPSSRCALIYSYDDAMATAIQPHHHLWSHRAVVVAAHGGARRCGWDVDVVPPGRDLSAYELVLAPATHLVSDEVIASLRSAIDAGALVIVGPRSLVADSEGARITDPWPAVVGDMAGAHVDVFAGQHDAPVLVPGGCDGGLWCETYELVDDGTKRTKVLARWSRHAAFDGCAGVVRRDNVVLMGASSADAWAKLIGELTGRDDAPHGIEVVWRDGRRIEI